MAITPLPPAPLPTDSTAQFNTKAFEWVASLEDFVTETNATAVQTTASKESAALSATASANSATASANSASASATFANASATSAETAAAATNAVLWVSGTTYAIGFLVYSPIDKRAYRRLTAGAGTTDPSADATNWSQLTRVVEQSDIGTAPNEIPLNQYLGSMAFQDLESVVVGQVKFTGTSSTDPNTLDSYEEGTWTPSIGGDATYFAQTGTYTKIGNVVHVSARLHINVKGTGSGTTFSGLPFANGTQAVGVSIGKFASAANSFVSAYGEIAVSSTTGELFGMTVAGNANYVAGFFTDGTSVNFSATYTV